MNGWPAVIWLSIAMAVRGPQRACFATCYEPLLEESLRHAERYFAFSYPRDVWYVHCGIAVENGVRWLRRNSFRAFVHPTEQMTHIIRTKAGRARHVFNPRVTIG
jgi:hypothetical protein